MNKEPCLKVQELAAQAQALIDSREGIQSWEIREALGCTTGMFKHVTPLLKCVKERNGYQFTYYNDLTYLAPKPDKAVAILERTTTNTRRLQALIDQNKGITGLHMRIQLGMELRYFTVAIKHCKTHRANENGVMVYYKTEPKPIKPPPRDYIVPIFTLGDAPRTIWRTEVRWAEARA